MFTSVLSREINENTAARLHLRSDADPCLRGVVRDASEAVDHAIANLRLEVEAFLAKWRCSPLERRYA